MSKNFILIGNPIAGGGALGLIRSAEARLKGLGFKVEVMLTARRGDAEAFARSVSNRPGTTVIAAGGDGTYNEVANGLVGSAAPMAILPVGTTSVLARELRIPFDLDKALDVVVDGRAETVSVGKLTCRPSHGAAGSSFERYFLLMAGVGIDADAVYGVNVRLKKFSGRVAYVLSGLRALLNYNPEELVIETGMESPTDIFRGGNGAAGNTENLRRITGYVAVVSKASSYGGDFKITPDADLKEPFLYVLVLRRKGKAAFVRLMTAILLGRAPADRDIVYFRTGRIDIGGSARIQLDGDYSGRTPATIEVVRNSLILITPNSAAR
jgi:diacylglycerol kinase family enzyme